MLSREAKFIIDKKFKTKKLRVKQQSTIYTLSKLSWHIYKCGEKELFSLGMEAINIILFWMGVNARIH